MRIPSGSTNRYAGFVAVDATDLKTRETGISSWTVYRSRNGGTPAAYTTPTVTELSASNMPGMYALLVDEDTTLTAGRDTEQMLLHITATGVAPISLALEIYRPETTEGNTLGVAADGDISGNLDGTVATVTTLTGHTAQTGDNYARLGAPAGASVSADIAAIEAQTDDIGAAGAGLTAIPWNSAWDAEVESEVNDALLALHLDHLVVRQSTAQAGAAGTITLDASASSQNDLYNDQVIELIGGTGAGQTRLISDYDGTTKVATIEPDWAVNPDATSEFIIWVAARVRTHAFGDNTGITTTASGYLQVDLASVNDDFTAINNFEADYDGTGYNKSNSTIGTATALGASATSAAADAVWDEARADHQAAGSFGRSLQIIRAGTAQAGAATTITLDAGASASNNFYNNTLIHIIAGTGANQSRMIASYVGSTKVATLRNSWVTNPASDSVFVILPGGERSASLSTASIAAVADAIWDEPTSGHTTAGTFGEQAKTDIDAILADTNELQTDDVPGLIAALNNISTAQVNAEVVDVLKTDTISEMAQGAPPAAPTFEEAVMYLYMVLRNELVADASGGTNWKMFKNDAGTVIWKKQFAESGSVYTENEGVTGP